MAFRINWSIDESEWDDARAVRRTTPPGSHLALDAVACTLLYGDVQLAYGIALLFPPPLVRQLLEEYDHNARQQGLAEIEILSEEALNGVTLSVTDLATQLHRILHCEAFPDAPSGTMAEYVGTDRDINLSFVKTDQQVVITSDLFDEPQHAVPTKDFVLGVRQFLTDVTFSIASEAPALLDWEALSPLRTYTE